VLQRPWKFWFWSKTALCTDIIVGAILLTNSWICHFFSVTNTVQCPTVKHLRPTIIIQLFCYTEIWLFIEHFHGWKWCFSWTTETVTLGFTHGSTCLSQAWCPFQRPVWGMEMILIVTYLKCECFLQVVWIERIETLADLRVCLMTNWLILCNLCVSELSNDTLKILGVGLVWY